MLPLLAAVALSCAIVSYVHAHLPYQEPSWPAPPPPKAASWLKTDKDQDQLAKGWIVPRVVPVEVYRRADYAQAQLKTGVQKAAHEEGQEPSRSEQRASPLGAGVVSEPVLLCPWHGTPMQEVGKAGRRWKRPLHRCEACTAEFKEKFAAAFSYDRHVRNFKQRTSPTVPGWERWP